MTLRVDVKPELLHWARKRAGAGFGITCLTPFEMLRREGARFVLEVAT